MSQNIIIDQMIKYLHIKNSSKKDIEDNIDFGVCKALSVCHAMMDKAGKRDEWETLLKNICRWDGQEESLKTYGLDDSLEFSLKYATEQIVFMQLGQHVFDTNEASTLISREQFFHPALTETSVCIADDKESKKLLDVDSLKNQHCFVYSDDHAIRVGYNTMHKWFVYDPNYAHDLGSNRLMYRAFGSQDHFFNEIKRVLGTNIITIQKVYENQIKPAPLSSINWVTKIKYSGFLVRLLVDAFDQFESMIENFNGDKHALFKAIIDEFDVTDKYNRCAFSVILSKRPALLFELLDQAENLNLKDEFIFALGRSMDKYDDVTKSTVFQLLLKKMSDDELELLFQGDHVSQQSAPTRLTRSNAQSKPKTSLWEGVIKALKAPITDQNNVLNDIVASRPIFFNKLLLKLSCLKIGNELKSAFACALDKSGKNGRTPLHLIANNEESLARVLSLVDATPQGQEILKSIARAISKKCTVKKNDEEVECNVLTVMISRSPKLVLALFKLVDTTEAGKSLRVNLVRALCEDYLNKGYSHLAQLVQIDPDMLDVVESLVDSSSAGKKLEFEIQKIRNPFSIIDISLFSESARASSQSSAHESSAGFQKA